MLCFLTCFQAKHPTRIDYDGHSYIFEGYSIFSHERIELLPECVVVIYNHEYKLSIAKEDAIEVRSSTRTLS